MFYATFLFVRVSFQKCSGQGWVFRLTFENVQWHPVEPEDCRPTSRGRLLWARFVSTYINLGTNIFIKPLNVLTISRQNVFKTLFFYNPSERDNFPRPSLRHDHRRSARACRRRHFDMTITHEYVYARRDEQFRPAVTTCAVAGRGCRYTHVRLFVRSSTDTCLPQEK